MLNLNFIIALLRFFRWPNLLLIALFFIVMDASLMGQVRSILDTPRSLSNVDFAVYIIDVLIVSLIGYWMNDYYDRVADKVNRPDRLLVRFSISNSVFYSAVMALFIGGAIITVYLGIKYDKVEWITLFPVAILALFAYARWGKKWGIVGNVCVSAMIASLPLMVLLSGKNSIEELVFVQPETYRKIISMAIALCLLIFSLNMAREIIKDAEDAQGDRLLRSNSLPIKRGFEFSNKVVIALLLFSASVQWSLLFFLSGTMLLWIAVLSFTISVFTLSYWLIKARVAEEYKRLSLGLKLLMFFGLLELIFLPFNG